MDERSASDEDAIAGCSTRAQRAEEFLSADYADVVPGLVPGIQIVDGRVKPGHSVCVICG